MSRNKIKFMKALQIRIFDMNKIDKCKENNNSFKIFMYSEL